MRIRQLVIITAAFVICFWNVTAEATRQFTVTQTNPAPTPEFDMGSTQPVTFRVTNTCTPNNTTETITTVRFRVSGTYTTFSNTTAAPAGWTRSAYSTTSITFTASSAANRIPSSGTNYKDFILVLIMRTSTVDRNDLLSSVRATFRRTTGGTSTVTNNNQGAWTLRSLSINSFTITDCAGVAIGSIPAGSNFCLVLTVRNVSSATQNNIISNPNPPAVAASAGITNATKNQAPATTYNPSPLNLAAGASGTITFQYTTNTTDDGTVSFTATARNGATVTSKSAVSPVLVISRFIAAIAVTPTCQYNGQNITATMTLTNGLTYNIINVTPTLNPTVGAPVVYVAGPAPGAPNGPVLANGGTFVFTWIYQVNGGNPGDNVTFTGFAQGTGQTGGNPPRTTAVTVSPPVKRGGFDPIMTPANTNAGSTNEEVSWTVVNQGCAEVNQVSVTMPAGWVWNADAYSLVQESAGNYIENWNVSVAGSNPVVFTSPDAAGRYPIGLDGMFSAVFTATPATSGMNNVTIRVTDENGQWEDNIRQIMVDPFDNTVSGQANYTGTGSWSEVVR
jgi:hypothetical protein